MSDTAEAIYVVGEIEPFDGSDGPRPTTVAVAGGKVLAVGGAELADRHRGRDTVVRRFAGAALLPGLTDCHIHPVWGSVERGRGVDLDGLNTLDAVLGALRAAAAGTREGDWVFGYGLDPNVFDGPPHGRMLAGALPGRPVSLLLRDAHSLVVSPRAVELAGLTGRETFEDRASVELHEDGAPSGLLLELSAMALVEHAYPVLPVRQQADYVLAELTRMAAAGLTGGHAMDFSPPSHEIFADLESRTELPIKLRCSPLVPPDSGPEVWREIAALQGLRGRRWAVEGVKFMLDGTIDNGTAWLEEPDCYGENRSAVWTDPAAYRAAVAFFAAREIPTATHAIGDRAVRFALDTIAEAGAGPSAPHRIEHVETIPDETVARFAALGVVASMQPIHGTRHTRADLSDNWSVRLGPERAARGWRCRDLRERGAVVALGSDWPIGCADPRILLADTQLRRPVERPGTAPVQPAQGLTARMAYEGLTTHAALAAGRAGSQGRIAPGYDADFTVFAENPLGLTPERQAGNPVLATVVDGRVQHG
ncbi:amidohydrolase family protein [Nonomuraea sp. NN258]|uniref:amidohydrolase n=1 Tax=Nonomuraea antri TaxID=2730852 RepID=UPI0015691506|nr:amidohydrolase family protein [Nonomuraea antri]NRQ39476.1 amidohydrolase family protein [Nonomuraea antri]